MMQESPPLSPEHAPVRDPTQSLNPIDRIGRALAASYAEGSVEVWASQSVEHVWTVEISFNGHVLLRIVDGEIAERPSESCFQFKGELPDGSIAANERLTFHYPFSPVEATDDTPADEWLLRVEHSGSFALQNGDVRTVNVVFRLETMRVASGPPYKGMVFVQFERRHVVSSLEMSERRQAEIKQLFVTSMQIVFGLAFITGVILFFRWLLF
ncbi:MAG: hypothetical protein U0136_12955 [Bdellovibrionota bacterium]